MRNTRCPFCIKIFDDKHKYCHHIASVHNDQVPEDAEPLEFAYSLLVHKPMGRVCVMCRQNKVAFNQQNNHPNARDFIWDDQHKFRIIGTYEEDFLKKLRSLGWSPNDVIAPSPNNYWYTWKDGTLHLYIPDFYIPSLSLEVEIKESDNHHPRMEHAREIERLKDQRLKAEEKKTEE